MRVGGTLLRQSAEAAAAALRAAERAASSAGARAPPLWRPRDSRLLGGRARAAPRARWLSRTAARGEGAQQERRGGGGAPAAHAAHAAAAYAERLKNEVELRESVKLEAEYLRGLAAVGDEFDAMWRKQVDAEVNAEYRESALDKLRRRGPEIVQEHMERKVLRALEGPLDGRGGRPNAYTKMLERWVPQLADVIRREQKLCMVCERGLDRSVYGPYLMLLEPEVVAYIVVAETMKRLFVPFEAETGRMGAKRYLNNMDRLSPLGSVRVVKLATALGAAVQEEVFSRRRWAHQRKRMQTPAEPQTERWTVDRCREEVVACLEDRVPAVRMMRPRSDEVRKQRAKELAPSYAHRGIDIDIEGETERRRRDIEADTRFMRWEGVCQITEGPYKGQWEATYDVNGQRGQLGPFVGPQMAARLRDRCVLVAFGGDTEAAAPHLNYGRGGWTDHLGDYSSELEYLSKCETPDDFLEPLGLSCRYGVRRYFRPAGQGSRGKGAKRDKLGAAKYLWGAEVPLWDASLKSEVAAGMPEYSFRHKRVNNMGAPEQAARAYDRFVMALRHRSQEGVGGTMPPLTPGMDTYEQRRQMLALRELPLNFDAAEYSAEQIAFAEHKSPHRIGEAIHEAITTLEPLEDSLLMHRRLEVDSVADAVPLEDLGETVTFRMVERDPGAARPEVSLDESTSGGRLAPPGTFKREVIGRSSLGHDVGITARDELVRRLYFGSANSNSSYKRSARGALSGQDWPIDVTAKLGAQLCYHLLTSCEIEADSEDDTAEVLSSGYKPVQELAPDTKWTAAAKQFYGEKKAYGEFDPQDEDWLERKTAPAFYHGYTMEGAWDRRGRKHMSGSIQSHPKVVEMMGKYSQMRQMMEPAHSPMVVPPAPFEEITQGQQLVRFATLMRSRNKKVQKEVRDASFSRRQHEDAVTGAPYRPSDPARKYHASRQQYMEDKKWAAKQDWHPDDTRTPLWGGLAAPNACQMWQVFDAINCISSTRWRVNTPVLDVLETLWKEKEMKKLEALGFPRAERQRMVSLPQKPPPHIRDTPEYVEMDEARQKAMEQRRNARQKNIQRNVEQRFVDNVFNLAKRFAKDEAIYYPHTLDFRGRAYPMHGTFNHMGSDYHRGMLMFADGKRLGEGNRQWLCVHLANLCGNNKISFEDRAAFADEHIEDILDSANNPLNGRRWWLEQDHPAQVLAACMELRDCHEWVKAGNNEADFVSHLPVQMDGSCNGLQHYAALALDYDGAASVNLIDDEKPGDVYTNVAQILAVLVDEDIRQIKEDIKEGKVQDKDPTQQLEFFEAIRATIDRKLVKQTVMTSVYGVTTVGARQQVQNRLVQRDFYAHHEDPENMQYNAAVYVSMRTLGAIKELFTEAKSVMSWLSECADVVAREGKEVCWTTPLGLPVVQPYKQSHQRQIRTKLQQLVISVDDGTQDIDKRAQRNGFPPNFIHSVDSSHMMKTASACYRNNVTFAAVHDSFWTHAATTERMSEILREEFVDLYRHDLLADLKKNLQARNPRMMFPEMPQKGKLDIADVRKARFFFS